MVVVCTFQELGVHTIEMSTFFEISSLIGFTTTNSTSINSNNRILSQDSYTDINKPVEACIQKKEEFCRKTVENKKDAQQKL